MVDITLHGTVIKYYKIIYLILKKKIIIILYMELNQYVFLTHIIFTIITAFYLISLFLSKSKINDNINRLGAWIMFLLFSTYLYIYDDYSSLFTNESSLFYWSGLLCFCYAYAIGAAQFKFSNINYIFAMILFCIGSLSYLYQSTIHVKYIN